MSSIQDRLGAKPGAKYRPVDWSDISKPGAPILGWGIGEKQAGRRSYLPVGWKGHAYPFPSKKDAQDLCNLLNAEAARP